MLFSIPIELGFEVLNEFMKFDIYYSRSKADAEPEGNVIEVDVDDDCVDRAEEIVDRVAAKFNKGLKGR